MRSCSHELNQPRLVVVSQLQRFHTEVKNTTEPRCMMVHNIINFHLVQATRREVTRLNSREKSCFRRVRWVRWGKRGAGGGAGGGFCSTSTSSLRTAGSSSDSLCGWRHRDTLAANTCTGGTQLFGS